MEDHRAISRYVSIIHRLGNMYFDKELSSYHIGSGQQFFLLYISEHPGVSLQELAHPGHYDKATATRAVHKLEEEGYVYTQTCDKDKRVRHIYATDKAKMVIEDTFKAVQQWVDIVTVDFREEEKEQAEELLQKMSGYAYQYALGQNRKE